MYKPYGVSLLTLLSACSALSLPAVSKAGEKSCGDRVVDCYMALYRRCGSADDNNPCVQRGTPSCMMRTICPEEVLGAPNADCEDCRTHTPAPPQPARRTGFQRVRITPRYNFGRTCSSSQRRMLTQKFNAAVNRLSACMTYAFVRQDIITKMKRALEAGNATIDCAEPARRTWCADHNMVTSHIRLSPSRMLARNGFCHDRIGQQFIHEMAHEADLRHHWNHNETIAPNGVDEVYSLQEYCFRPARMWIQRAARTSDVVQSSRVSCMRAFQERTVSSDRDPFWEEYASQMRLGRNPCP